MRFPSIQDVAAALRSINSSVDEDCDVRLQVYPDGQWVVHWGSADYDQDHRGFWGASGVPGAGLPFDARDLARDLIEQAREMKAQAAE